MTLAEVIEDLVGKSSKAFTAVPSYDPDIECLHSLCYSGSGCSVKELFSEAQGWTVTITGNLLLIRRHAVRVDIGRVVWSIRLPIRPARLQR